MGNFNALTNVPAMVDSLTNVTAAATAAISTLTPELNCTNGHITTTSIQVAQHFGKRHGNVLKAIRNLECSTEYYQLNFEPVIAEYRNGKGGAQQAASYRLTRDGFVFLAMGFTGKEAAQWKEAYITAFNKMEAELLAKVPYSVAPRQTLSPDQADTLRNMLMDSAATMPKDLQGIVIREGWSKLKSHFKVGYREIPQASFLDAVSLVSRHIVHWSQEKALPAPLNNSTATLQLMRIITTNGVSTVEMLPIEAIPELVMNEKELFNSDLTLKIASSANLRMMGNVTRTGLTDRFERLQKEVRNLDPLELLTIARDGWMELGLRTALTNELAAY